MTPTHVNVRVCFLQMRALADVLSDSFRTVFFDLVVELERFARDAVHGPAPVFVSASHRSLHEGRKVRLEVVRAAHFGIFQSECAFLLCQVFVGEPHVARRPPWRVVVVGRGRARQGGVWALSRHGARRSCLRGCFRGSCLAGRCTGEQRRDERGARSAGPARCGSHVRVESGHSFGFMEGIFAKLFAGGPRGVLPGGAVACGCVCRCRCGCGRGCGRGCSFGCSSSSDRGRANESARVYRVRQVAGAELEQPRDAAEPDVTRHVREEGEEGERGD